MKRPKQGIIEIQKEVSIMPKLKDLTGMRFGRLVVLERDTEDARNKKYVYWKCKCDCGNIKTVRSDALGVDTNSCGCLKEEQNKKNLVRFTTGESHSRLANIWYHMRARCSNPKTDKYDSYGGRGIKVYEEWDNDFLAFKEWSMENGYYDGLTIDRIDVDKDYTPDNCRWIPFSQQSNNKRGTLWIFHNNEWKSLMESYREENPKVTYQTVKTRYHKGETDVNRLFR